MMTVLNTSDAINVAGEAKELRESLSKAVEAIRSSATEEEFDGMAIEFRLPKEDDWGTLLLQGRFCHVTFSFDVEYVVKTQHGDSHLSALVRVSVGEEGLFDFEVTPWGRAFNGAGWDVDFYRQPARFSKSVMREISAKITISTLRSI